MRTLRHLGLAMLVFVTLAVPFERLCAPVYEVAVRTAGAAWVAAVGPGGEMRRGPEGGPVFVDRRGALRAFFSEPANRPSAYGLLVVWAWLVVAPRATVRRRLARSATAAGLLAAVAALGIGCDALAWYTGSVAAMTRGAPTPLAVVLLDALGAACSIAAVAVLPAVLCLAAHPGLGRLRAAPVV